MVLAWVKETLKIFYRETTVSQASLWLTDMQNATLPRQASLKNVTGLAPVCKKTHCDLRQCFTHQHRHLLLARKAAGCLARVKIPNKTSEQARKKMMMMMMMIVQGKQAKYYPLTTGRQGALWKGQRFHSRQIQCQWRVKNIFETVSDEQQSRLTRMRKLEYDRLWFSASSWENSIQ